MANRLSPIMMTAPPTPSAPTNWRCSRCGQPNSSAAMKCPGCQAPRSDAPVAVAAAARPSSSSSRPIAPSPAGALVNNDPFNQLGTQKRFSHLPIPPAPKDPRQQLAELMKYIREDRKAWTVAELKVNTQINILEHPKLLEDLKLKVKFNERDMTFEYKAKHAGIRHRADLEEFLRLPIYKFGILADELNDAYIGVLDDIKALAKEDKIHHIINSETKKACIYPRVRLRLEVDVDPRIQELWHRVTMPLTDGQLEEKLIKSGHMQKQAKKGPVAVLKQKAAKSHKRRKIKMTNTHLAGMGLGQWIDDMAKT